MTVNPNYLVDTGVFILYFRGNRRAIDFLEKSAPTKSITPGLHAKNYF